MINKYANLVNVMIVFSIMGGMSVQNLGVIYATTALDGLVTLVKSTDKELQQIVKIIHRMIQHNKIAVLQGETMFDNSLRKRIDKIEAKLWDVETPNGEVFKETDSCGRIYDELRFRYFYNGKIYVADLSFPYSVSFHPCDIDYAKTSMGYIFTNRHRTFWLLVKYGSKKAIEIPKPFLGN